MKSCHIWYNSLKIVIGGRHMNWREYIESTPDVLRGKPRIKGTRIPVSLILGYFAAGNTVEKIIQEFPDLNREQLSACLDFARDLSEFEAIAV
jgi:uncharacterized protein (DUF433 family)